MTRIIAGTKTEFSIDPAILDLLPAQGSVELQRDAAGKVHPGDYQRTAELHLGRR
jgi:hypothetical protein